MKDIFRFILILFCLHTTLDSLHAQWSTNPDTNNAICTAVYDQLYPSIVSDGAGGAIIVWVDYRGGYSDIYAQRINALGIVQWKANGVAICTAAYDQYDPSIVSDGAGGAIITWEDHRSFSIDIYAQRINSSGVVRWDPDGVLICTASYNQHNPNILSDGAGGAIITWQDLRNGIDFDMYAQRINASGIVQWTPNGVAISTATNNQIYPNITNDGADGAIITWLDNRSGTYYIYAQHINASGVALWAQDCMAIRTAAITIYNITSDGIGGAIITWQNDRNGYADIYAQHINASGVVQWTPDGVAIDTSANNQLAPTIVNDGVGGAIITWHDLRSGTNFDIYAQHINESGVVQWTQNGVAIDTAAGNQVNTKIVCDGAGGAIITWDEPINGNADIHAQHINESGVLQWTTNGIAICTAPYDQLYPAIVNNGSGGAIFAWCDYRSGNNADIYAQLVSANGTLGGTTNVNEFGNSLPKTFSLEQNYPNPFNPTTMIRFDLPKASSVSLKIFNILGQEIASLVNDRRSAGRYEIPVDGSKWASGVYFYRLQTDEFVETKKLLLMK